MRYAVKKRHNDEWLIHQPGGRLDHWGPDTERAEYKTKKDALDARRLENAERFAVVVVIPTNAKDLQTYHEVSGALG